LKSRRQSKGNSCGCIARWTSSLTRTALPRFPAGAFLGKHGMERRAADPGQGGQKRYQGSPRTVTMASVGLAHLVLRRSPPLVDNARVSARNFILGEAAVVAWLLLNKLLIDPHTTARSVCAAVGIAVFVALVVAAAVTKRSGREGND
jgi:hypothetical protein